MEFPLSMSITNNEEETLEIAGRSVASLGARICYLLNKLIFALSNCEKDLIRLFLTVRYELDPSFLADKVIAGRFFTLLAIGEYEVRYRIAIIDEKETEDERPEFKKPETLDKICEQIKNLEQIVSAVRWKSELGERLVEDFILSHNELDKIDNEIEEIGTIRILDFIPIKECMDQEVVDLWANFKLDKKNIERKRHSNLIRKRLDKLIVERKESEESRKFVTDVGAMELLMAEFEEKFLKHRESISLKEHRERLRSFMEIWKKEAEKGRRKGRRSLMELLQELGEERASTFEEVKAVAIDIGTNISRFLDLYFWILAIRSEMETVMRSLGQVEAALKCLTVEGKSIFLDGFLAVLNYTKFTMSRETVREVFKKMEKVDRRGHSESEEKKILLLLLREILRLEVGFCYPDEVPTMLTDEVLLSMGNHLRNVFDKKLNQVGLEMEELLDEYKQSIDDKDKEMRDVAEQVESKIITIWNNLEL